MRVGDWTDSDDVETPGASRSRRSVGNLHERVRCRVCVPVDHSREKIEGAAPQNLNK